MVPTTAGSGSEWSWAAVVTNDLKDGRVCPYVAQKNYPDAVVIDPDLSLGLSAAITAHTGVDALGHAIEAYTSCRANVVSDMFAAKAMELIGSSLRLAFSKGCRGLEHRTNLAFAAAAAMVAVCSAGVGLAHFMNDALSQRARLSHGCCVGLMLPYVMEFNLVANPAKYADVARLLGEVTDGLSVREAADLAPEAVRRLLADLGMPQRLRDVGIGAVDIPELVEALIEYQSVPIGLMNPRDVGRDDAAAIYTSAL